MASVTPIAPVCAWRLPAQVGRPRVLGTSVTQSPKPERSPELPPVRGVIRWTSNNSAGQVGSGSATQPRVADGAGESGETSDTPPTSIIAPLPRASSPRKGSLNRMSFDSPLQKACSCRNTRVTIRGPGISTRRTHLSSILSSPPPPRAAPMKSAWASVTANGPK